MTREEANFIGGMNMCDEISNEAYRKIMCHCEEQEPCKDAISRQAVIDILDDMTKDYAKSNDFEKVNGVAWVKVQKLPSVNPKKIGHWVDKFGGVYRCSECRELIELDCEITTPKSIERFRYCPNCGARMEGGAE